MNLYLDEDLIKRAKHAAIESEKRLSDFVAEVLQTHLDEFEREEES